MKKPIDLDLLKPESDLLAKDDDLLTGDGDATDEGLDDDDDDDEDDTEDLDDDDDDQEMADEPAASNAGSDGKLHTLSIDIKEFLVHLLFYPQ